VHAYDTLAVETDFPGSKLYGTIDSFCSATERRRGSGAANTFIAFCLASKTRSYAYPNEKPPGLKVVPQAANLSRSTAPGVECSSTSIDVRRAARHRRGSSEEVIAVYEVDEAGKPG